MPRKFGWLAPSGNFIECGVHEHIDAVMNSEEMMSVPKVAEILNQLDEMEKEFAEFAAREGSSNAEWHLYEIACDNAIPKIVKHLYRAKYLRVGETEDCLHFEGFPNVIKSRYQECKDFAEQFGMAAVFEPQREPC